MLENLLKVVKQKYQVDIKQSWYKDSTTYLDAIKEEIEEVEAELRENNSVYLEDELGDILWGYLNALEGLAQEGKISSLKSVLARAEKKYSQRVGALEGKPGHEKNESWNTVKERQKQELLEEHNNKYNS